jgi:hypothetical protein
MALDNHPKRITYKQAMHTCLIEQLSCGVVIRSEHGDFLATLLHGLQSSDVDARIGLRHGGYRKSLRNGLPLRRSISAKGLPVGQYALLGGLGSGLLKGTKRYILTR